MALRVIRAFWSPGPSHLTSPQSVLMSLGQLLPSLVLYFSQEGCHRQLPSVPVGPEAAKGPVAPALSNLPTCLCLPGCPSPLVTRGPGLPTLAFPITTRPGPQLSRGHSTRHPKPTAVRASGVRGRLVPTQALPVSLFLAAWATLFSRSLWTVASNLHVITAAYRTGTTGTQAPSPS